MTDKKEWQLNMRLGGIPERGTGYLNTQVGGILDWGTAPLNTRLGEVPEENKIDEEMLAKPEPVYEYQWLVENGHEIICITGWHKTIYEVFKKYSSLYTHAVFSVHRLDKYKREVKE